MPFSLFPCPRFASVPRKLSRINLPVSSNSLYSMISQRATTLLRSSAQRAVPTTSIATRASILSAQHRLRPFTPSTARMSHTFDHPIATLDSSHTPMLPDSSPMLFEAKKAKNLSFQDIGKELGRDEVAVAALFYGQAKASAEDVKKLSGILGIDHQKLEYTMYGWPDRGRSIEMPPKEPLIYRLYEIVQNYGYAFKAVINEKFGDGIMSAISFSTKVEKDKDEKGEWVVITLRGKWLPYTRF